ncbi:MAG TPA: CstA-like transporter-associated (seleno)protein [Candidatus Acidoferrum sp.]|nr:CstA-like transporter-associated (seleno)protein [Candidatus Acidoferrum sp.]
MEGNGIIFARRRNPLFGALRAFWRGLREWCGDAAYDRYLASRTIRESTGRRLTRTEFYVEQANRRYSRPNRCC